MKLKNKIALGTVCAVALCALGSEIISGDYNTTLGYLAGQNASGNRVTAMGAGSAGESYSNERTTFFGAACGTYSSYIVDCVAMGYRALRNAMNKERVVAIGAHALEDDTDDRHDLTWINGQFFAEEEPDTFYIKPDPEGSDEESPIFYSCGELHLNADKIITRNGSLGGGVSVIDGLRHGGEFRIAQTNLLEEETYLGTPAECIVSNLVIRGIGDDLVCNVKNYDPYMGTSFGNDLYYPRFIEVSFLFAPTNGAPWKEYRRTVEWGSEQENIGITFELDFDRYRGFSSYTGAQYYNRTRNVHMTISHGYDISDEICTYFNIEVDDGSMMMDGYLSFYNPIEGKESRTASNAVDSRISRDTPASTAFVESRKVDGEYDLYLAPWGDDRNDGSTPLTPVRTLTRCYEVATNDAYVCVFAGTYEPPTVTNSTKIDNHRYSMCCVDRALTFKSIEGKDRTFLVGGEKGSCYNDNNVARGEWNKGLAFYYGYQTFIGFTVREMRPFYGLGGTTDCAPPFCCVRLVDCTIYGTDRLESGIDPWCFGHMTNCAFINCEFIDFKILCNNYGGYINDVINYCYFENVAFRNLKFLVTKGYSWDAFGYENELYNTLIQLAPDTALPNKGSRSSSTNDSCTIVVSTSEMANRILRPMRSSNVAYVVNDGTEGVSGANIYVPMSAIGQDGLASGIDSPLVRTDGRKDWGWKDSGLALRKIVLRDVRLSFENGVVTAFTNGVPIGTVQMVGLPDAGDQQSNAPRSVPPLQEEEDDDDGEETVPKPRLVNP